MVGWCARSCKKAQRTSTGTQKVREPRVLIAVLGVGALRLQGDQLNMTLIKGVGDVLEEHQAEHDMLVLSGVHVPPQLVRRRPQRGVQVAPTVLLR